MFVVVPHQTFCGLRNRIGKKRFAWCRKNSPMSGIFTENSLVPIFSREMISPASRILGSVLLEPKCLGT